jgi:iron only hydrogenase large subunit-like protein
MKDLHVLPVEGLEGVKSAELTLQNVRAEWRFLEGVTVKVGVAHGLANTRRILEAVRNGAGYHFIEIMTCPGGCIGGGGQPRFTDDSVRLKRIRAIYREDEGKKLRKSHDNPQVKQIYEEFLGKPLGEKSHHLLHTTYTPRERV